MTPNAMIREDPLKSRKKIFSKKNLEKKHVPFPLPQPRNSFSRI